MNISQVFDPRFTPPLHLDTDPPLATDVFLIVLDAHSSIQIAYQWCLAFLHQFTQSDQVSLLILADPLHIGHLLDHLMNKLEQLELPNSAPDLVIWSEEIAETDEPALYARCLAYLDCNSRDEISLPLLKAIFMNKQVVCFKGKATEEWIKPGYGYFLNHLTDTETAYRQALFELYHRLLKLYPRKLASNYLAKNPHFTLPFEIELNIQSFSPTDFRTQTMGIYEQGYVKEAAMLLVYWAQNHPLGISAVIDNNNFWLKILKDARLYEPLKIINKHINANNPENEFLLLAEILIQEGNIEEAVQNYHKVLSINPYEMNAKVGFEKANLILKRRSEIPPIFLNGIGNPASEYISILLSRGLDIPRMSISSGIGIFELVVDVYSLEKLAQGGCLAKDHLSPSDVNLFALTRYLDKMILGLRDPRGSLVSCVVYESFLNSEDKASKDENLYTARAMFSDKAEWIDHFLSLNFHQKCDKMIEDGTFEHYLNDVVNWLDVAQYYPIFIYTFEEFKQDEMGVIQNILNYYDLSSDYFRFPFTQADRQGSVFSSTPDTASPNYTLRRGNPYEWHSVLTPAQLEKTTSLMPHGLCKKMGWLEI
ncbi:MAG: sulfotransferase domain-containing protein [Candidatus Sericytochromatia bacterium]|nr:sulfotransferase domain-containing protein [Candidatus Sericytochromatia bacterium]